MKDYNDIVEQHTLTKKEFRKFDAYASWNYKAFYEHKLAYGIKQADNKFILSFFAEPFFNVKEIIA